MAKRADEDRDDRQVDAKELVERLEELTRYIERGPSMVATKDVQAFVAQSFAEVARSQRGKSKALASAAKSDSATAAALADVSRYIGAFAAPEPTQLAASHYADALRDVVRNRLVHLGESGAALAQLGSPGEVAEQWASMLPLAPSPLEDLTGPFFDTSGLRQWLGLSRQALDSRARHGTLLSLSTGSGQRVYPTWQWRADGTTIPHLAEVLQPLLAGARDPWTVALWMTAPTDHGDGREIPAWQWLDEGGDPAVVVSEARADAARWAS